VTALHDKWKVDCVALGHCTGEPAFAAFQRAFGVHYNYAGLGSVIELPWRIEYPSEASPSDTPISRRTTCV